MLWATSPALTEIENQVLDWLVDLLGLPQAWKTAVGPGGGVIQMSASDSTHVVHVVAREKAVARGASTDDLVAYGSSQAHSSVERGARIAGLRHVRLLEVDAAHALRPDRLQAAVADDLAGGLVPTIVTSAIGTTATGAVDPVAQISAISREHGLWHHVDAAWAGAAMCCAEHRRHQAGTEHADSYTFNPHKWLFTNFDCNVLWVADRAPLITTLSTQPPYLRNPASESGAVIDYRHWHVPSAGASAPSSSGGCCAATVPAACATTSASTIALAQEIGRRVDEHPALERIAPVSLRSCASATSRATRRPTRSPTPSTPRRPSTSPRRRSKMRGSSASPSARRTRPARTSSGCGRRSPAASAGRTERT